MGKRYYPQIAEVTYDDKKLKIKIPIRVKLLITKEYCCNACDKEDEWNRDGRERYQGLKNWLRWGRNIWVENYKKTSMKDKGFDDSAFEHDIRLPKHQIQGVSEQIPEYMIKNGKLVCPHHGVELKAKDKKLIKMYATMTHEFIKIDELLNKNLPFQWKQRGRWPGISICAYATLIDGKMDEVYKQLNEWDASRGARNAVLQRISQATKKKEKKRIEAKLKVIPGITVEQLETCEEDYQVRKFSRRLD